MTKVNISEEKELIRRYQLTKNPLIYKELERRYNGIIQKCVLDSGLAKFLADKSTVKAQALAAFQKALNTYSDAKGAQPNTYIMNTINLSLKNYKNREMSDVSYRSEQMNRKAGLFYTAVQQMKTDPTADMSDSAIVKYIKTMKTAKGENLGKDFTRNDIRKIRETERRELMGNEIVNPGTGEDISVSEIFDNHKVSVYDVLQQNNRYNSLLAILKEDQRLSLKQKNYIKRLVGLGRTPKAANESQARINSGVTTTEAFRAKQIIQEDLKKKGMI